MRESLYVAPMTAVADGEVIDGSARLVTAETVFPDVQPLVIEHDGTRPVIMVRTDIPNADDPRAVRIALEANRIAQLDFAIDPAVLADIAAEMPDIVAGLWTDDELAAVLAAAAPAAGEHVEFDTSPQLGDLDYRIMVFCADESTQRAVLQRLESEGLTCRALIL